LRSHNYYYFVATLQSLEYGGLVPMEQSAFIQLCQKYLTKKDADFLCFCQFDAKITAELLKEAAGSDFIQRFLLWERDLALSLTYHRTQKLGRSQEDEMPLPAIAAEITEAAQNAVYTDNPRLAMISLDTLRWQMLDSLIATHDFFGVSNVYAYLLKLILMERLGKFDKELGAKMYRESYGFVMGGSA
jgi:hypothetical protein